MAKREMQAFEVYDSKEGFIAISQEVMGQDPPNIVIIHPEQVDTLVKWLKELKDELSQSS